MAPPLLFGADYSVYVRTARLALEEKRVDYELVPVDIFDPAGPPAWYAERQPFGKIPAFEHDGLRLFETGAITRYVDEAFEGPGLQPDAAFKRAVMNQIVSILDSYAYRAMVWGIYVERVSKPKEGGMADEARIAAALPIARTCLATLEGLKADGDWLLGDALSLADLHAAPVFAYFTTAPEGAELLPAHPALSAWWERMAARESMTATERS